MVGGMKPPDMNIHAFEQQLIAELAAKLKLAGYLISTQISENGTYE